MIENCRSIFMCRSIGPLACAMIVGWHTVLTTILNLVLFPRGIFNPIESASSKLINSTLCGSLYLILFVFPLIFWFYQLRPKDVSLNVKDIPKGLLWTLIGFLFVHCVGMIVLYARDIPIEFDDRWSTGVSTLWVGKFFSQIFGNAFYEEVIFRGLLLPQCVLLLKKRYRKMSWGKCFWFGLLISQIAFALIHIPNRIHNGTYVSILSVIFDQLALLITGSLFAFIFLLSRNLFVAIGFHSLVNFTPYLFADPGRDVNYSVLLLLPVLFAISRYRLPKK